VHRGRDTDRRRRRTAIACLGALLALAARARPSDAASYQVRWTPTGDTGVAYYNVYTRQSGSDFGDPRNAGFPPVGADGTMTFVVNGLPASDVRFAVTAVASNGVESRFSNEVGGCTTAAECGDGNACTVDSCNGFCSYTPVADGTSCSDGDVCDGVETCRGGICQPGTPLPCDDGDECTLDGCTATGGCTHVEIPSCSLCVTSSRVPLEARRLKIVQTTQGIQFTASGIVGPLPAINFGSTGLVVEVVDGTGASLVRSVIPGNAIESNRGGDSFHLRKDAPLASLGGVRKLRMRRRSDSRLTLSVRGKTSLMPETFPTELTLLFLAGTHCAVDTCTAFARTSDCR
jgi:Dictyostelium (slime mold) repeat